MLGNFCYIGKITMLCPSKSFCYGIFPKNQHFLPPDTHTFRKFCMRTKRMNSRRNSREGMSSIDTPEE